MAPAEVSLGDLPRVIQLEELVFGGGEFLEFPFCHVDERLLFSEQFGSSFIVRVELFRREEEVSEFRAEHCFEIVDGDFVVAAWTDVFVPARRNVHFRPAFADGET